ncbi:hypothetical protein Tco_0718347 [Tanacetum coccineum]
MAPAAGGECGDPVRSWLLLRCPTVVLSCTCKWCGYGLREGFCWFCALRDGNSSIDAPKLNSFNDPPNEKLHKALQAVCEKLNQQEQAANVSTHTPEPSRRFNIIYDYDNDDEESTIPLNKITSQIPPSIAITPDSLSNPRGNLVTFSNPLFDANDDFTSSDDESLPEEDVQEEDFKIYSKPLYIDVSTDIEDGYHDSEGDIIYLECLLINDTTHNLPPEVFLDHDPRSLKDEPDNDDLKSVVKVFDPRIHEKIISMEYGEVYPF